MCARAEVTATQMHESIRAQLSLSRCSSLPSDVCRSVDGRSLHENAWMELQRELGSLKAENQLGSRGGDRNVGRICGGSGGVKSTAHEQGSAALLLTGPSCESSDKGTQEDAAVTSANSLSLGIDRSVIPWGHRPAEATGTGCLSGACAYVDVINGLSRSYSLLASRLFSGFNSQPTILDRRNYWSTSAI